MSNRLVRSIEIGDRMFLSHMYLVAREVLQQIGNSVTKIDLIDISSTEEECIRCLYSIVWLSFEERIQIKKLTASSQ